MKLDLVMWTKNAASTLAPVLQRLNRLIPGSAVNHRFSVDDGSTDGTREILRRCEWDVVDNQPMKGVGSISSGANIALSRVETEVFASFERDLMLSKEWFDRVPRLLKGKIAVASGVRFADRPRGLRRLQQYVARKYMDVNYVAGLRGREMAGFTFGKTIDNTVYRTGVLRELGGFPRVSTVDGVDSVLVYRLKCAGYSWKVDCNVQSVHLRRGLREELRHQQNYGGELWQIWRHIGQEADRKSVLMRLLYSPFSGVYVALKTLEPSIAYVYPLVRLYYARGLMGRVK